MLDFFKKKPERSEGVRFLASILVCFAEISTISYEPKDKSLHMTFALQSSVSQEGFNELTSFLTESIHTYQLLDGMGGGFVDFSMEVHDEVAFFHVIRDLETLSSGELRVITSIVRNRFEETLVMDSHVLEQLDAEFAVAQEEAMEQLFEKVQAMELHGRLVGVREGNHVVVYDH